ncbi:hypothetical protein FRACA_550020 [Frankia canadensis]|uniref:Uncharacterized protein n=1 Tax=Frankia canadensis TaxID=1836972 RepID=A0A2I2KYX1_9ACTN|nr:hypothetical protein FRACA_550020 [Frankia canadensis]SOU58155.1 hypothetical protein FRACA_550020 [Frankia canadensis]
MPDWVPACVRVAVIAAPDGYCSACINDVRVDASLRRYVASVSKHTPMRSAPDPSVRMRSSFAAGVQAVHLGGGRRRRRSSARSSRP